MAEGSLNSLSWSVFYLSSVEGGTHLPRPSLHDDPDRPRHAACIGWCRNNAPQNVELGFWTLNSCMSWGDELALWKHYDTFDSSS